MTAQPSSHRLDVPGGNLYYEVRGSGPLLLVVGQPMTSGSFGPLADQLAEDHTVVTYDPHGLGESTVQDPTLDVTPEVQADDLARIVDALGRGPADVFASSGGAVSGLAFAVRHPDKVRTLIAHEPPVTELLPDAQNVRAAIDVTQQAYRQFGSGAGWGKFVSLVVHNGPVPDAGVPDAAWPPPGSDAGGADAGTPEGAPAAPPEPSEKAVADDALFFLHMLKPITRYQPVIDALRRGEPRVVIAVGAASRDELAIRSATALADRLEVSPTVFPGDHAGFMAEPAEFARAIREVIGVTRLSSSQH